MRDLEIQPTAAVYNIIINAFSVRNMYSEAEETYRHMQENKVEPDAITFETLMGMYCEMHDYKQVNRVSKTECDCVPLSPVLGSLAGCSEQQHWLSPLSAYQRALLVIPSFAVNWMLHPRILA
jgi:pentatricopeptide repeat protein